MSSRHGEAKRCGICGKSFPDRRLMAADTVRPALAEMLDRLCERAKEAAQLLQADGRHPHNRPADARRMASPATSTDLGGGTLGEIARDTHTYRLGLDFVRANVLEIDTAGRLTGRLVDQCWGDICDGAEKRRTLLEVASLLGVAPQQCMAVGDGANDLPMMQAAGLSVAYRAKPRVREQARVAIDEGGLDRLLQVLPA